MLLPRFEVKRELGRGSLGTVFEVWDSELQSLVALKSIADPSLTGYLTSEFRVARQLKHRNIARLYELFAADDSCYFTMELVRGVTITRAVQEAMAGQQWDRVGDLCEQLVGGLSTLHEAGFVHRDVKPENVLVDDTGRVVLLDFDLAIRAHVQRGGFSGTPAYMAPEALWGNISSSGDWFSVGAVLVEAITGQALSRESALEAARLQALISDRAPSELAQVLCGLVSPNVRERLSGVDLVSCFGRSLPVRASIPFLGRTAELESLARALREAREHGPRCVLLEGPAGIGKSALVDAFLGGADDVLPVRASFSSSEVFPFAGIDNLVASISDLLHEIATDPSITPQIRLAAAGFASLSKHLPPNCEPVLGPPQEVRGEAIRAAAQLIAELAKRHPVVLVVEDLQWADARSCEVLAAWYEYLRSLPVLFVLTRRSGEAAGDLPDALRTMTSAPHGGCLGVGAMAAEELHALIEAIGAKDGEYALERALGNPLIAAQIAVVGRGSGLAKAPGSKHHRLLQVVSVAVGPLPRGVACRAAQLGDDAIGVLRDLEVERSIRLAPDGRSILPFHDLIRESALAVITAEDRVLVHRSIADELIGSGSDRADLIVPHLRRAGDVMEAARRAVIACEAASAGLAFEKEATYATWAAEGHAGVDRVRWLERSARAWYNGGYLAKAATQFDDAAAAAGDPVERKRLQLEAAENWVRAGHSERGAERFFPILRERGVNLSRNPGTRLLSGLLRRLRGLFMRLPNPAALDAISSREATLDVLYRAGNSLSMTDVSTGFDLLGRFLLETLRAPSRERVLQALGGEASFAAAIGGAFLEKRAERLLEIVDAISESSAEPLHRAGRHSFRAIVAWELAKWAASAEHADHCQKIIRAQLPGRAWELRVVAVFAASSLFFSGDADAMRTLLARERLCARDRGDPMGLVHLEIGDAGLISLLDDAPETAWKALRDAEKLITIGPNIETYYHTMLAANVLLYEGRAAEAATLMAEREPALSKGGVLGSQIPRAWYSFTCARALFSSGEVSAASLLKMAKQLQRGRTPAHRAWGAHLVLLAARSGDAATDRVRELAARAAQQYTRAGMPLFAWAVTSSFLSASSLPLEVSSFRSSSRGEAWLSGGHRSLRREETRA